jgi:hypothetical protein
MGYSPAAIRRPAKGAKPILGTLRGSWPPGPRILDPLPPSRRAPGRKGDTGERHRIRRKRVICVCCSHLRTRGGPVRCHFGPVSRGPPLEGVRNMQTSRWSRISLACLVILGLSGPVAAATRPPADAGSPLSWVVGWLDSLWSSYYQGATGSGGGTRPELGCIRDPNGHTTCSNSAARPSARGARLDLGCIRDPDGQMICSNSVTRPSSRGAQPGLGCGRDPNGNIVCAGNSVIHPAASDAGRK